MGSWCHIGSHLIMKISWKQTKTCFRLFIDIFLWLISVNIFTKKIIRYNAGPSILDSHQVSRMNISNSYLFKFYLIYLNLKNLIYLEKVLTKVSTNCVVIAFILNELLQVNNFKQKVVLSFMTISLKSFFFWMLFLLILWALFSFEKLQRYNMLFHA